MPVLVALVVSTEGFTMIESTLTVERIVFPESLAALSNEALSCIDTSIFSSWTE